MQNSHYQVKPVLELKPESVLEIGKGNGIVSGTLKQAGFKVTTADIDNPPNKVILNRGFSIYPK